MATTVTVNSSYAGAVAGAIIGASFNENDAIRNGVITVLPNIKYRAVIRLISYTDGRRDYTCGFTPQGAVTISEKELIPKKIMNEMEICKEDFTRAWDVATMGPSAHNNNLPRDEAEAFINEVLAEGAQALGVDIWQGLASNTGEFDGFIKRFKDDATVIKHGNGLDGIGAPITKTNVVGELEKVTNAIPNSIRGSVRISVAPNVADAYLQSLVNPQITNGLGGESLPIRYLNYLLYVDNGLPANTIVAADPRNLIAGTELTSDTNSIRTQDMDESDLSGQVRFKMVYSYGTQIAKGDEILWYLSTAS